MVYTLSEDFARKIPSPAPPPGHHGLAQLGQALEFGYGPLHFLLSKIPFLAYIHISIFFSPLHKLPHKRKWINLTIFGGEGKFAS